MRNAQHIRKEQQAADAAQNATPQADEKLNVAGGASGAPPAAQGPNSGAIPGALRTIGGPAVYQSAKRDDRTVDVPPAKRYRVMGAQDTSVLYNSSVVVIKPGKVFAENQVDIAYLRRCGVQLEEIVEQKPAAAAAS